MIFNFKTTGGGDADTLQGHGAEYFAPKTDLANYLSKSGGVITAKSYIPLVLTSTDYGNALLQFIGKDGTLGYIGFEGADELKFFNSSGGLSYELLHTGNMADHVLPKSGGEVDGIVISGSNSDVERSFVVRNGKRRVSFEVTPDGAFNIWDSTNQKHLIQSPVNGSENSFHGTATGNLPLIGGGTVEGSGTTPLIIRSWSSSIYLDFENVNEKRLGAFGFMEENKPVFVNNAYDKVYTLHHDGNSAKVHIGTSAPSDTTALWIDTSA